MAVYLAPVLPRLAEQTGKLLGEPITRWEQSQQPLLGTPVGRFQHLMQRVERRQVDAMIAASTESEAIHGSPLPLSRRPQDSDAPLRAEPLAEQIGFDEFAKVDLRVARIVAAEDVPGRRSS